MVLLLSLILTFVIYCLPIVIYRCAIRNEPVEPKKARRIVLIYAVPALLVMTAVLYVMGGSEKVGGAIVFWSFINYKILTGGD